MKKESFSLAASMQALLEDHSADDKKMLALQYLSDAALLFDHTGDDKISSLLTNFIKNKS